MRHYVFIVAGLLHFSSLFAQDTIDFDDENKWKKGSGNFSSYQNDHVYEDANWVFTAVSALRQGRSKRDGFQAAIGRYSWRIRNQSNASWSAAYHGSDVIGQVGFKVRRWDASPSSLYEITFSFDGGKSFEPIDTINNAFLNNSSNWQTFNYRFQNPQEHKDGAFIIHVSAIGKTERIMIDDFSFKLEYPKRSDIFISEYIDGSQNNKYLEVYNPLNEKVDLTNYELRIFLDGSDTPSMRTALYGELGKDSVRVFAHPLANAYSGHFDTLSNLQFDGNDAIELYNTKSKTTADVFGKISCNPGSEWKTTAFGTRAIGLRRAAHVCKGVFNPSVTCGHAAFDSLNSQWLAYARNDVSGLGIHRSNCMGCDTPTDVRNLKATISAGIAVIQWSMPACFDSIYVFVDTTAGVQNKPSLTTNHHTPSSTYKETGQLVYKGKDTSITIYGLLASQTYSVEIFSKKQNDWSEGAEIQVSHRTKSAEIEVGSIGLEITFDDSKPGINEGQFSGKGLLENPGNGMLNSNSWRFKGVSNGATNFSQRDEDLGFFKGSSTGEVSAGGIYAFEVAPSDMALGVQPTADNFSPGCMILRLQNTSTDTLSEIGLSYDVYMNNNEQRANSFSFSHSVDEENWIGIIALSDTTPEKSDNKGFVKRHKLAFIRGVSILPSSFFYLRWCIADVSGKGSRDELAIDNILIVANPGSCGIFGSASVSDDAINLNLRNTNGIRYARWSTQKGMNHPQLEEINAKDLVPGAHTLFLVNDNHCSQYIGPFILKPLNHN